MKMINWTEFVIGCLVCLAIISNWLIADIQRDVKTLQTHLETERSKTEALMKDFVEIALADCNKEVVMIDSATYYFITNIRNNEEKEEIQETKR